jgi:hypothetical protein
MGENIITVVLGIKNPAILQRVEQVKSQLIPCNFQHHFGLCIMCLGVSGGWSSGQS